MANQSPYVKSLHKEKIGIQNLNKRSPKKIMLEENIQDLPGAKLFKTNSKEFSTKNCL